ncbi:MAG TPA: phage Gp37/Gp68 family protein [Steroidobacteraceae bacterium]|nr:phage Gp37/Gp68 family protein [Steroidobacteraceae bacterium]
MGDRTGIEWTDATWNPVSGCTKVSQACKGCYAERLFPRAYAKSGRRFTDVQCHPERLDQPLRWKRPRRIFVNSMSDLFHENVPFEFIDEVFHVMARAKQHTFQILTKRPKRMHYYINSALNGRVLQIGGGIGMHMRKPLPNVWLGVSVEDQQTADERVPVLLRTPAALRFLSCEPLLGFLDLDHEWLVSEYYTHSSECHSEHCALAAGEYDCAGVVVEQPSIGWVIVGGESGPSARCELHPDWVRHLREQCVAARVPFFFKQWGNWAPCFSAAELSIDGEVRVRVGDFTGWMKSTKREAGREIDGRTWDEVPTLKALT